MRRCSGVDQDIRRLDVAVDDTLPVRMIEGRRHPGNQGDGLANRQSVSRNSLRQRGPRNEGVNEEAVFPTRPKS